MNNYSLIPLRAMANDRTRSAVIRLSPIDRGYPPLRLVRQSSYMAIRVTGNMAAKNILRATRVHTAARVVHVEQHALAQMTGIALFPKLLGKIAATLLVPLIFLHPFIPLYAEELSASAAEMHTSPVDVADMATDHMDNIKGGVVQDDAVGGTQERHTLSSDPSDAIHVRDNDEQVLGTAMAADDANTAADEAHEEFPEEEENSDATGAPPATQDIPQDGLGDAPRDTEADAAETIEQPLDSDMPPSFSDGVVEEGGGVMGTDSASSTDPNVTGSTAPEESEVATSSLSEVTVIPPLDPDESGTLHGTVGTSSELATSSEAYVSGSAVAGQHDSILPGDIPEQTPSFEERLSAELEARSAILREEIRRQVEREWTSGCVALEGTGYYCLKYDARNSGSPISTAVPITTVVARPGTGGDNEIFITKGTEDIQLTENDVDDAFPAKDASGASIVWQSQENGRWQIYFADMTQTPAHIIRISSGTESNFHPKVDGRVVVWQVWLDNNWEIVAATRRDTPIPPEEMTTLHTTLGISGMWDIVRVTHDPAHDMFPSIAGGLITWQKNESGRWGVWTHSMTTGTSVRLSSTTTKSEHPRLAMVWEERQDDGTVRLVGYDLARGEQVDLTKEARNIPDRGVPVSPESLPATPDPITLPSVPSTTTLSLMKTDGDDGDGSGDTEGDAVLEL